MTDLLAPAADLPRTRTDGASAAAVLDGLRSSLAGDFLDLLVDPAASRGSWLSDELRGDRVLDMGMYFSSAPLGHNPDCLRTDAARRELAAAAATKPSNPDFGSRALAATVEVFGDLLAADDMPYMFFVDGGALAVENALKVAFDWKAQRDGHRVGDGRSAPTMSVLHLRSAFHGRSGYTLSLTNTDPTKTALFPTFDWPRIDAPAVDEDGVPSEADIDAALAAAADVLDAHAGSIACFVYEPIQGEGGDRHVDPRFLRELERLCADRNVLTVADEVQMGGGLTGARWAHETLGLAPDLIAFGKKTQVCGVIGGRAVRDVGDNAFVSPGRISSTWGGSLVDIVRARLLFGEIAAAGLFSRADRLGTVMRANLDDAVRRGGGALSAPRSRGLVGAISLPDRGSRDRVLADVLTTGRCVLLPCGTRSVRWRPSLTATEEELRRSFEALLDAVARESA